MKKVYQGKRISKNKSEIKKENFNNYMWSTLDPFAFVDPFTFCYGFMTEDQVKEDFKNWKRRKK